MSIKRPGGKGWRGGRKGSPNKSRPKPGDPGYDRYMQKLARKEKAKIKPKRKPKPGTRGYKAWANKDYTKASTSGPRTASPKPKAKSNNSSMMIRPKGQVSVRRNTRGSRTNLRRK